MFAPSCIRHVSMYSLLLTLPYIWSILAVAGHSSFTSSVSYIRIQIYGLQTVVSKCYFDHPI